ncbi:MAG: thioredoxin domain-containing protein, partial [Myxococcales bacterium]|nr:thioredoxin domain-containing protein [Myxococcales bacterium]
HFEKMLYDNALLVGVYLDAYQLTGREEFAAVAGSTLDYLDREMCAGDGFYAATDADSLTPAGAREEGYYFTWAEAEIDAALEGLAPPDIAAVKAHYGVTPGGNFEGRSILHVARPLDALALELSRPREELAALVDDARQRLRRARDERPRPLRDDKLITAWNGLAISAFARGGFLLKREELLFRAVAVASRYDAGPLTRVVVDEAPRGAPVLADHVYLAQGMLDLFEATGQPRWLEAAVRRQAEADARYRDPATGVYYETAVDGEALLVRAIEDFDGATPSGSSIAAHNLLRLAVYQGDEAARERGVAVLRAFARALTARPTSLASLLAALERTLDSPREVAIVHPAPADAAALDALLQPVREVYSPSRALVIVAEPELDDRARAIPWLAGKRPRDGAPTAYVCERGRCEAPTADPATLRRQLAVVAPLPQPGPPDP